MRFLCWYFTIRVLIFIISTICHGKSSIQQDEGYFYQQMGLKFGEKVIEILHLSI
jgi:hypothetical protein